MTRHNLIADCMCEYIRHGVACYCFGHQLPTFSHPGGLAYDTLLFPTDLGRTSHNLGGRSANGNVHRTNNGQRHGSMAGVGGAPAQTQGPVLPCLHRRAAVACVLLRWGMCRAQSGLLPDPGAPPVSPVGHLVSLQCRSMAFAGATLTHSKHLKSSLRSKSSM
jgi:hypothetical protein